MQLLEGNTAYTMFRNQIREVKILKVIPSENRTRYKCSIASETTHEVEMERDQDRIFPSVQALTAKLGASVVEFL